MPLRIRIRSATADESNERSELEPRPEPRAAALRLAQLSADDQATEIPASSLGLGSRALRNTVIVLTAKVAARLIALVTVLYMVRWLGPPRYGSFSVLVNLTAIAGVMLDLGFNVLFVREGARDHQAIQRYLRNVMSLRLLMSAAAFVILAAVVIPIGLGGLLLPGFVLMVLTSYSSLLRNGLYAVQELGFEAVAVVLESAVLLGLILYGGVTGQGVAYYVWAYAIQYAFSCAYFIVVLWFKRIARVGWRFELPLLRAWFLKGLPFALTFVLTILYFRIDQPLIYTLRSHTEAGWCGAAYKPIESLLCVPSTCLAVVVPVFS